VGSGGMVTASAGGSGGGPALTGCAANPANLIANCSFETPVVDPGGYQTFGVGTTFEGWNVVGGFGNVAVMSGSFADRGFTWSAHDGAQMVDLTGVWGTNGGVSTANSMTTGVAQTVATTPGANYHLSFWIGNVVDVNGIYGVYSAVRVMVNGIEVTLPQNNDGDTTLVWDQFTFDFMATDTSTTIGFVNGDSVIDNSNVVDDIELTQM